MSKPTPPEVWGCAPCRRGEGKEPPKTTYSMSRPGGSVQRPFAVEALPGALESARLPMASTSPRVGLPRLSFSRRVGFATRCISSFQLRPALSRGDQSIALQDVRSHLIPVPDRARVHRDPTFVTDVGRSSKARILDHLVGVLHLQLEADHRLAFFLAIPGEDFFADAKMRLPPSQRFLGVRQRKANFPHLRQHWIDLRHGDSLAPTARSRLNRSTDLDEGTGAWREGQLFGPGALYRSHVLASGITRLDLQPGSGVRPLQVAQQDATSQLRQTELFHHGRVPTSIPVEKMNSAASLAERG